jgi:hypothetical protein
MSTKTFHILIATIGRKTLQNMLNSLLPQLSAEDCVTVVYDGFDTNHMPTFNFSQATCKVNQLCEPVSLGYWGHGIRNKYANLLEPRDFVLHADDDNIYLPGAFKYMREKCTDFTKIYILETSITFNAKTFLRTHILQVGNVDTANGVIPYEYNKQSHWGLKIGGDGEFYVGLQAKYPNRFIFLHKLIYFFRPHELGIIKKKPHKSQSHLIKMRPNLQRRHRPQILLRIY